MKPKKRQKICSRKASTDDFSSLSFGGTIIEFFTKDRRSPLESLSRKNLVKEKTETKFSSEFFSK